MSQTEVVKKCPKCGYLGRLRFRQKTPHYICDKCGFTFNGEEDTRG